MFLLPKGNPLAENLSILKLQLPAALEKLKNGRLTGYAVFNFPAATSALLYNEGRLLYSAVYREGGTTRQELALKELVEMMLLASDGSFSVYALPKEITSALMGFVGGNSSINSQPIRQIDFKGLLEKIRRERMTATLQIDAADRTGQIYYCNGATVGFFHDRATDIENSAGEVQQIAALPDSYCTLYQLDESDGLQLDLAGLVDIASLWAAASDNPFETKEVTAVLAEQPVTDGANQVPDASAVEAEILDLAGMYIGKLGRTLAEKELLHAGGVNSLKNAETLQQFLTALEKSSRLLTSANRIKEMKGRITAIAERL